MSEPRKNHLAIDGGQVKEDEHIGSYKAIPETDTEFRSSKPNLSKSREKVSSDGAEEKLLQKEDEAKITTRVDMADAKYVVGDHRNGDAKIELDANKKFSGLTKEELLKYADDPFWVRLRWFMFILFWALWLCMLAGAIAIIIRAPKCAPPPPKTWFEKGPLVDMSSVDDYNAIETELPLLQSSKVQGIFSFVCKDSYEVLDRPDCLDQFKTFLTKAKQFSVKVIVDLTANFVPKSHIWFRQSENRTGEYDDYFIWATGKDFDEATGRPKLPNNWVSTQNTRAWTWSEQRKQYYLHQYGEEQPDLNFTNPVVVRRFDDVIKMWMKAGADGIRLYHARQLLVNSSLADEGMRKGRGSSPAADHEQYKFWQHQQTTDQPALDALFAHWSYLVDHSGSNPGLGETVFTLAEEGDRPELFLLQRNSSALRPPSAAPQRLQRDARGAAAALNARLTRWPAMQLKASAEADEEIVALSLLLPAAPVLDIRQLEHEDNATKETFERLVSLREDASVEHGNYSVAAAPARNTSVEMLACVRWKPGHTGYAAVFNPTEEEARADLSALPSVPAQLTVHYTTHAVRVYTNYTSNLAVPSDNVLVPPKSSVVLSYVPKTTSEK